MSSSVPPGPDGCPQDTYPHPAATPSQQKGSLLSLNFLKALRTEKKGAQEGNPPKRRGPKPDSKPALSRRQELNRQAQRTHRERKELYIKALEDEVTRLKEIFRQISQTRESLVDENEFLKVALSQRGIPFYGLAETGESTIGGVYLTV